MTFKMIRRTHALAAVAVVSVSVITGTAYALSGNPADGPNAGSGQTAERDFLVARLTAVGKPELAPAKGARVSTAATTVDGGEWSLSTYRNVAGQMCFSEAIPAEGRAYACNSLTTIFARGPLSVSWGSRQLPGGDLTKWDQAWVLGFAAAPITTVELVYTNCAVETLPLNADGAFQTVTSQSAMRSGSWPFLVRGLTAQGAVVAEDRADLQQPNARGVPIKAPVPGTSCAK